MRKCKTLNQFWKSLYLRRAKLRQPVELTQAILKKPRILEVILLLDTLFEEIQILHDYEEIKALAPKSEILASIRKKLSCLREEARDDLVGNGMAVPKPQTPIGATAPPTSATELPAPKRTRIQRFGNIDATDVPPISVYTSQGRLAAILND